MESENMIKGLINNNKQESKKQGKSRSKYHNCSLLKPLKDNEYMHLRTAYKHCGVNQKVARVKTLSKTNKGSIYESVIYRIIEV